jgi:YHS domain-containing protein
MTSIRTSWRGSLTLALSLSLPMAALGLAAGCGGESTETNAPAPGAPPAETPPSATKEAPGATKTEPAPEPAKTETSKAPETPPEAAPKIEPPKVEPPKTDAPKGGAAAVKLSDEEIAAIKKLPAEEQPAALKQAVCPVSGEHLGEMGTPVKISAEGKSFYLCCKGCKEEVDKDPKAVLAKLGGK